MIGFFLSALAKWSFRKERFLVLFQKPFCLDGSRVQNEFSICICLDEGLSKDQLQHPIKVRFERSCKVYDVMGLALWMYQVAVDQGNEDDNPKL